MDDFPTDPPSSDIPQPEALNIDMSRFPRPLPMPYPLSIFSPSVASTKAAVRAEIGRAAILMQRLPTADEANAIAYHVCRGSREASYGTPSGIIFGTYYAWAGRDTWRFPFRSPAPGFIPERVGWGDQVWLSGMRARNFWHALRYSSYIALGVFVATTVSGMYGATTAALGQITDPRLAALKEALRRKSASVEGTTWGRGIPPVHPPKGIVTTGADDGSPTQGTMDEAAFARESEDAEMLNRTENHDGSPVSQFSSFDSPAGRSASPQSAWARAAARNSEPSPTNQGSDSDFFGGDDDSSMSEGSPRRAADSSRGAGTSASNRGNSWEAIRREAVNKPPPQRIPVPSKQQREGGQQGGDGESFSYSSEDERRQLAKEQAQKEFDMMLERERNISGGGDEKRW